MPIIGMDCSPVRDLLTLQGVALGSVAREAGLGIAIVRASIDEAACGDCRLREILLVRDAVERLLPGKLQTLRHWWREYDRRLLAGLQKPGFQKRIVVRK